MCESPEMMLTESFSMYLSNDPPGFCLGHVVNVAA